ncbi:probable S-formylglutathione hydrolase [Zygosaccharomyces bailii]|nr:probable S-formylglutathione hydrolase [Zygosaccharomyces bailii]
MSFNVNAEIAVCGGKLLKLSHYSDVVNNTMDVNIYLPQQYFTGSNGKPIPSIYFLSGLTCTPQNASEKAFWQLQADKYGFTMVFPDTSPRGEHIPDDPAYDFGVGAGFYLNATQEPYKKYYQMYDYVHKELPRQLNQYFNNNKNPKLDFLDNVSITGHSMGGYGALSGYLQNYHSKKYKSCSAFAPIVNPMNVPWGQKAFKNYLGNDRLTWRQYDPSELVKQVHNYGDDKILIHQGTKDPFLNENLRSNLLIEAARGTSWEDKIDLRMVDGFDHSYYFISSFVPIHAEFHAKHLGLI